MAYTYNTLIAAIGAAATNGDILAIKVQMQADMAAAGLAAGDVANVDEWLDQILNSNTFIKNQMLLNNAAALFALFSSLTPTVIPPQTPYKAFIANLTAVGVPGVNLTIFQNTIGNIIFTNPSPGLYYATLLGAFPVAKTWVQIANLPTAEQTISAIVNEVDSRIEITTSVLEADVLTGVITGQATNSLMSETAFEIRVYN